MDGTEATSLEQIRAFLAGSGEVRFAGQRRQQVYDWVEKTPVRFQYTSLDKRLVRRYLSRMTGLSLAQVTRWIALQRRTGRLKAAETYTQAPRVSMGWPAMLLSIRTEPRVKRPQEFLSPPYCDSSGLPKIWA